MAKRLRIAIGTAVVGLLFFGAIPANADEFVACWTTTFYDPFLQAEQQITRCRLAGGEVVDYASDDSVPGRLYPRPGTDVNGACWYYSSADVNWIIAELYANGDAILGYTVSNLGGFAVVTGRIPRCTSEPVPDTDPIANVWDYILDYIHPPPLPALSPEQGDGVTGLDTYLGVAIPDDHVGTLNSGATILEVEIEVSGITVDWGDDTTDTYPADREALAGYPDGIAIHTYETKSDDIVVDVSYQWTARWRVVGGTWAALVVPDTETSVDYPVSEIVSVITG